MKCSRFEQLVQEFPQPEARDRIGAESNWQEHLAVCADCNSALNDDQLLRGVLTSAGLPQPPSGLTARILNAWSVECRETQQATTIPNRTGHSWQGLLSGARQRMALLATGLAACTLLMLQSPLSTPLFRSGSPLTQQAHEPADSPSLVASMRGVYQSVAQARLETPQLSVPGVDSVIPALNAPINESELADVTSQKMLAPIAELKDEFHPLGEKVSRAVGFLWKTIPVDESL